MGNILNSRKSFLIHNKTNSSVFVSTNPSGTYNEIEPCEISSPSEQNGTIFFKISDVYTGILKEYYYDSFHGSRTYGGYLLVLSPPETGETQYILTIYQLYEETSSTTTIMDVLPSEPQREVTKVVNNSSRGAEVGVLWNKREYTTFILPSGYSTIKYPDAEYSMEWCNIHQAGVTVCRTDKVYITKSFVRGQREIWIADDTNFDYLIDNLSDSELIVYSESGMDNVGKMIKCIHTGVYAVKNTTKGSVVYIDTPEFFENYTITQHPTKPHQQIITPKLFVI